MLLVRLSKATLIKQQQLGKAIGIAVQLSWSSKNVLAVSSQANGYLSVNYANVWAAKTQRTKRSQGAVSVMATKPVLRMALTKTQGLQPDV